MSRSRVTRRQFLATASVGTASALKAGKAAPYTYAAKDAGTPAILGGKPVRTAPFPKWPIWGDADEQMILPVLRSGVWSREKVVAKAEKAFAQHMGSKYCVTTTNGTNALITALHALGVGGGDEGGAILGEDEKTIGLCYSFHNLGRPAGRFMSREKGGHPILGSKCRMAEYQASILLSQIEHVDSQTKRRSENADYLTSRIKEIPGIVPRSDYAETTRTAYYYCGFRYKKDLFDGLTREKFVAALSAEGIPCSSGIGVIEGKPTHQEGVIETTLNSKTFQKIYSKGRLDEYREQNRCPVSAQLRPETVGFHGRVLLGTKQDMDDICSAIVKIYEKRAEL